MRLRQFVSIKQFVVWFFALLASGPLLQADDPWGLLKKDVGTWTAEMKIFVDPSADPMTASGTETVRMLGQHWSVSDFKGDIMGQPFEGHFMMGYDSDTKKYIGFWAESMSPHGIHMTGTWDEGSKTMTMYGTGKNEAGEPEKTKGTTTYVSDDERIYRMYVLQAGTEDNYIQTLEIKYKRK